MLFTRNPASALLLHSWHEDATPQSSQRRSQHSLCRPCRPFMMPPTKGGFCICVLRQNEPQRPRRNRILIRSIRHSPSERGGLAEHPKPHKAQRLIERVRRFPAPEAAGRERFGEADANPLSHVARVEAINAVYELFSVPRARSLITDARRLLGHALRDADLLQDLLDDLDDRTGFPRGALVVGLGMLGEAVGFGQVVPDRSDDDAAAAWALPIVLADLEEAEEALEVHRGEALNPARRRLETALRRGRGRYLISTVG